MSESPMQAPENKKDIRIKNLNFDGQIWSIEYGNDTIKLLFDRVDKSGEWNFSNIFSAIYFNNLPKSQIQPSQFTPPCIYKEEDLGSFTVFQTFIKFHTDMIALGATCDDQEFIELMKHVVTLICGYYGIPENMMIQIPFADGTWVKQEGYVYYCHLRRMLRSGRFYTTRIRQSSNPGIESVTQHQQYGEIDMVETFYLSSNIVDEPVGKPVIDSKDGNWPKPFSLAV